jgi:hypothetical protein
MEKRVRLSLFVLCSILMAVGLFAVSALAEEVVLSSTDCVKCHDQEPADIAALGAKHKTAVTCQDCHIGHPPKVENNIPECSMCHSGSVHYELADCIGCHNPHKPLEIALTGELTAPCLTCHDSQKAQLDAEPSKHTALACNFCHADRHGVIPPCVKCHEPHSAQMTQADCGTCHKAHKPATVTYAADTPNIQCAACHETAYQLLVASPYKHKDVACVSCHADKHKTVPLCSDCHGLPHAEGIHAKFPKCGDCHNIGHDLNK